MKPRFVFFFLLFVLGSIQAQNVTLKAIDADIDAGNFSKAKKSIDLYIAQNNLSAKEIYDLNFKKDALDRISIDFSKSKDDVVEYIRKYYPDVNDAMLLNWEAEKSLEMKVIDGQKRYMSRAAPNLFRIDKDAIERKLEIDGFQEDNVDKALKTHLPADVDFLKDKHKTQADPVRMKVKYTVTLKPNAVPVGEMVRCWLPYPREDNRRQKDIKLMSVSDGDFLISPPNYAHRTLYMQKIAEKGKPTIFSIEFSYSSAPEWFDLANKRIRPYDKSSELYKRYTAERGTHILFTDKIKELSEKIVGDQTDPYQITKKIFDYIDDNYPWAGAREYSTLDNIPEYVIDNKHGDCGQVTLLFITLARYNGIPAKWQSGFMMHPNGLNLHDWAEVYYEGIGWMPVDQSFGRRDPDFGYDVRYFFLNGIDAYRWIVNDDYSQPLFPAKIYPRSETVDFQRGELEWSGGNIYFNQWDWDIDVEYSDN